MSSDKDSGWLQGQFDRAAADHQKEEEEAAKRARKRMAVRKGIGVVVLLCLIGLTAAALLNPDKSREILKASQDKWIEVTDKVLPDPDKETGRDKAVSKAKQKIGEASKQADQRDAMLDDIYEEK